MESRVIIAKTDIYDYYREAPFRPTEVYPETPFQETGGGKNLIYELVREGFRMRGIDQKNFGTASWNPLGDIIKPGDIL